MRIPNCHRDAAPLHARSAKVATMRTLTAAISLAVFVGCTETGPVEVAHDELSPVLDTRVAMSAASSDVVRGELYIDIDIPSTCFGGALVHLEGPVEYRIHTTTTGSGVQHGQAFYSWTDVVVTMGPQSWHATAGREAYMVMNYEMTNPFLPVPETNKLDDPAVFHHVGAMRFKSDGDQPDLYVHHVVQLVTDSDGNLRVARTVFDLLDCR